MARFHMVELIHLVCNWKDLTVDFCEYKLNVMLSKSKRSEGIRFSAFKNHMGKMIKEIKSSSD